MPEEEQTLERIDEPTRRLYRQTMADGDHARLLVMIQAPGRWIAASTFVPPPYRGQGIAEAMVERLVADARAEGARILPTCWFVADEFDRHAPEWDDVRAA